MAVLETIRHKFGILITALIAVALLSFIVDPSSLLSSMNSGERQGEDIEVATINGHKVYYTEFYDQMNFQKDSYPFEAFVNDMFRNDTTMNFNDTELIAMLNTQYDEVIRNRALSKFIMDYNYNSRAQAAGFNVCDQEVAEYLASIYGVEGLVQIESQVASDESGRLLNLWNNMLPEVKSQLYLSKYNQYLLSSSFENPLVVEDFITGADNFYDVDFVWVPFVETEVEVEVTEEEKVEYYNAHKNQFKSVETRDITYLLVELDEENIDSMEHKADSVFATIAADADLVNAAVENDYVFGTFRYPANNVMSESDKLVYANEYVFKWAYKQSNAGEIETFNITDGEKDYMVLAILSNANDSGFMPYEEVAAGVELLVSNEKRADATLAMVAQKVQGLATLDEVATAIEKTVSKNQTVIFGTSTTDLRFAGAVSVAEQGVLNAPFKGSNGVYVYVVNGIKDGTSYTDDELNVMKENIDAEYMNIYNYYQYPINSSYDPGFVKDNTILHF